MGSPEPALRYEQVAHSIERLIERGTYRPGEKVPSVRKLSRQHRVSVSTVQQAYSLLESRGLLQARDRSGYYVRAGTLAFARPAALALAVKPQEVTVCGLITQVFRAAQLREAVVPLGAAIVSPELFPTRALARTMGSIARTHPEAASAVYDFPPGNEKFRREISKRALALGCPLVPEEILVTDGCMEALNLALSAVARPGETIAVESPTYYGTLQAIENHGLRALEIPSCADEGMDLDRLEQALRSHKVAACLAVPTFNNPTGSLMPEEKKRALVELLERYDVPLIEDDIYGDQPFDGVRPRPAKSFDRSGNVLLCSSVSKTLGPGLRVGWIAGGRFQEQLERLKFTSSVATASLPQLAVADFLRSGAYDRHLRRLRRAIEQQVQLTTHGVLRHFPKGTRLSRPRGGYLLWAELPEEVDSVKLHAAALAKGISISPGPIFSASGAYMNFIRINCGNPWSERIERALAEIGKLVLSPTVRREA